VLLFFFVVAGAHGRFAGRCCLGEEVCERRSAESSRLVRSGKGRSGCTQSAFGTVLKLFGKRGRG